MTTDTTTYRRTRHSVSLLHAHPVFVTKTPAPGVHRRHVHLHRDRHARRRAELDVEFVEFNGETDQRHLARRLPAYLAISVLAQRLEGRTANIVRREFTCARIRGHLWSPSHFAVSGAGAPLSIIKQYIDGQARPL
ncbi:MULTISPECIES: transposase [unclassified Mycobacterium]|uniref:transposase n=1 Tax=unclassified Mycobacterium TaxID=2642494 RepID=UPI0029C91E77|nr:MULTISPECIES: transposase [unclassified Mycobacterium]